MPKVNAIRHNNLQTVQDDYAFKPKTAAAAQSVKDSIDKDAKAAPTSPSKISEIFSSVWQWMTTPFAGGALLPAKEEAKIEAVSSTPPMRPPRLVSKEEIDIATRELTESFHRLNNIDETSPKGSWEKMLVEQYKGQIDIYEESVLQGREKFVAKQSLRKFENKEYQDVRVEYDKITQDSQWWQTLYKWGLGGVALATTVAAGYSFGTAPSMGEGVSSALKTAVTWGVGLFAGVSAINGVAQANLGYKSTVQEGKLTVLKVRNQVSDLKLKDIIDFLGNSYSKYSSLFIQKKEVLDKQRETSQFIHSNQM